MPISLGHRYVCAKPHKRTISIHDLNYQILQKFNHITTITIIIIFIIMEKENLYMPNPKLKKGDRIVLVRMDGDDVPPFSKGTVIKNLNNPDELKGEMQEDAYWVEFFDPDTNKFITKIKLLADSDVWIYDIDHYENETLKESLFYVTKKNINKVKL